MPDYYTFTGEGGFRHPRKNYHKKLLGRAMYPEPLAVLRLGFGAKPSTIRFAQVLGAARALNHLLSFRFRASGTWLTG